MTTDKTPKPFHIGTEVTYHIDKPLPPGRVAWAYQRKFGETVVYVLWPEDKHGNPDVYAISDLYHADDGSPLGEWEPISEEQWDDVSQSHDGSQMLQWLGINAIIRGEVPQ